VTVAQSQFSAEEIRTFLEAIDRHLPEATRVVIIGGSAAALAFEGVSTTEDIDTGNPLTPDVQNAVKLATAATGLMIPMGPAGVAEFPYEYESRLERQLVHLTQLQVWTLERHDLVLSKAVRGDEHDLQQISEIHRSAPLDFDTLVDRFKTEMKYAPVTHGAFVPDFST
jgi:hypothetical protein